MRMKQLADMRLSLQEAETRSCLRTMDGWMMTKCSMLLHACDWTPAGRGNVDQWGSQKLHDKLGHVPVSARAWVWHGIFDVLLLLLFYCYILFPKRLESRPALKCWSSDSATFSCELRLSAAGGFAPWRLWSMPNQEGLAAAAVASASLSILCDLRPVSNSWEFWRVLPQFLEFSSSYYS